MRAAVRLSKKSVFMILTYEKGSKNAYFTLALLGVFIPKRGFLTS